jgi:protein SCO1
MFIKRLVLSIALPLGLMFVYNLWPRIESLPELGSISGETLQSINGTMYDLQDNKIKLVTFFYTKCPDICPMTLYDLSKLKKKLQKLEIYEAKVMLISITLDPDSDSISRLKEYSNLFPIDSTGWLMLRGETENTKKMASEFRMAYRRDENGFITHNTTMYLLDKTNSIRSYHNMSVNDKRLDIEEIIENIKILINE